MPTPELTQLLSNGLQLLYDAHRQSAAQAQDSASNSIARKLKLACQSGAKQNQKQAKRLDRVFKAAGLAPKAKTDAGMQGIVEGNRERLAVTHDATERDLINIAYAQLGAHYYISAYGTLRNYARALGNTEAAKLLGKTLEENVALDKTFTSLANGIISDSLAETRKSGGGGLSTTLLLAGAAGLAYSLFKQPDGKRAG